MAKVEVSDAPVAAKMDVYDVVAMTIHANGDKMSNRTTIQKLIYFHTQKSPNLEITPYAHHFYGPFNCQVASALEEMTAFSYLDEKFVSGQYQTYHYTLTNSGKEYAKRVTEEFKEESASIADTVEICKSHCKLKAMPLSYAAKAHYILNHPENEGQGHYTIKDVQKIGKYFAF